MKSLVLSPALLLAVSAGTASASYVEVFSELEAANGEAGATFLDSVAVDGLNNAFAVLRDTDPGIDYGLVTRFDNPGFTTVVTPAQWTASGSTNDIAAGNGVDSVGGVLRSVSFFDNNVYEYDLLTGVVTEVVPKSAFDLVAGASVNLSVAHETAPDGTIFTFDFVTDQIYSVSNFNTVALEVSATDLGSTSVGGLGIAGNDLYIGDNSNDELLVWDTITDTLTTALTTAQIEAVTDDIDGRVGFGDILIDESGIAYFYESDSDYLLTFNVNDPVATLSTVLTEQELVDGPGTDLLGQLAIFDGQIAWTDQGDGFYTIPEPASLVLMGLGGLAMLRRRSA